MKKFPPVASEIVCRRFTRAAPSWAKLVRSLPGVDVALAAFSVKNYPPLAARYYMWAASTDMISPLRSWPISCPEESPMCRVASGSSRARPRA